MSLQRLAFVFAVCSTLLFLNRSLRASCTAPPSFHETWKVLSCEEVDLNHLHPPPHWPGLSSYQGVILEVNVLSQEREKSRKDPPPKPESLPKKTRVFYPTTGKDPCHSLQPGTQKKAVRTWACCDGDPNPPCLLGFSEYVYEVKEKSPR